MYKESLKFSLKCPKHKSFTPANGEGSIKGGCGTCLWLCEIHKDVTELLERVISFKNANEKEK